MPEQGSTVWGNHLRTDPGGKAYGGSEWGLKTNGREIVKRMHLLSEYANYGDWETESTLWSVMLYNRPVSLGVDYFVNKSNDRKASGIDVGARGFLKLKAGSGIGEMGKQF